MLRIQIKNRRVNRSFLHPNGPIEFGRAASSGPTPRFVLFDESASKCHLRVRELPDGKVQIENTSGRLEVAIESHPPIGMGQQREMELPTRLQVGQTAISLEWVSVPHDRLPRTDQIGFETIALPAQLVLDQEPAVTLIALRDGFTPERMLRWFETLVSVQRAAAGSPEFYQQTVQAVVQLVGMDQGLILLRKQNGWEVAACVRVGPGSSSAGATYSRSLVEAVASERRTLFRNAHVDQMAHSLAKLEAVVASPILGAQDAVIGVVYGSRELSSGTKGFDVGPLEAQVLQVLAAAVGTGLARQSREADAIRSRVQFEQFFSRELAEELERNPTLLEGSEREITVLFVDIRGFSRLAQRLAPRDYYRMAQDVLGRMTQRVQEQRGVVVDYTGDGLLAMWNAPFEQPGHPDLACRAALGMVGDLPSLSADWSNLLGGTLDIGIGLSTGPALVGNTGTTQKLKYGPRGHVVNLGSRIESATKAFGVRILLAPKTRAALKEPWAIRRLGPTRLPGLVEDIELYELQALNETSTDRARREQFEEALSQYASQKFQDAAVTLRGLLSDTRAELDVPTFQLLAKTLQCLKYPPKDFHPEWNIESK